MNVAIWVLIVATHVNSGANVSMADFYTKDACTRAAVAANMLAQDAGYGAHTWCVPKGDKQ